MSFFEDIGQAVQTGAEQVGGFFEDTYATASSTSNQLFGGVQDTVTTVYTDVRGDVRDLAGGVLGSVDNLVKGGQKTLNNLLSPETLIPIVLGIGVLVVGVVVVVAVVKS